MGFTSYMGPLRLISKQHTPMADPLEREFSASLHRGLSEELRELADFGLGGHTSDMHGYMLIEGSAGAEDAAPPPRGEAAQSWPLQSTGGNTGMSGGSPWIPRQFHAELGEPMQASEPMPAASASEVAIEGGFPTNRQMPVVITTYQGRRASWDAGDGSATWQGHQQQQFSTFSRLSGGNLDSGGGSGGIATSSDSPRGADADERRRMRRRTLNRESAKRARSRQRTQLEEAQAQVLQLGSENARLQEALKRTEAERDSANKQLDAARAQLGSGGRDSKPAPRSGAVSPALGRQSTRSSQVGSSAGSGASEQSSTRLGSVFQLPPRVPDPPAAAAGKATPESGPVLLPPTPSHPEAQLHSNDDDKPFGGTGWASMPPPPAVPRAGASAGRSPPRHATRQRQQRPPSPTAERNLRSASAPTPAMPSLQLSWSQPTTHKAASQPVPQLSTGLQPKYTVSTGIPTPVAPAPPPPRFQVPSQQQQQLRATSASAAGSGDTVMTSRSGRRTGLRAISAAESPFSDMSDTPFKD
jgi:hypothetical protein